MVENASHDYTSKVNPSPGVVVTYKCDPGFEAYGEFMDRVSTECLEGPEYSRNSSNLLKCGPRGKFFKLSIKNTSKN